MPRFRPPGANDASHVNEFTISTRAPTGAGTNHPLFWEAKDESERVTVANPW